MSIGILFYFKIYLDSWKEASEIKLKLHRYLIRYWYNTLRKTWLVQSCIDFEIQLYHWVYFIHLSMIKVSNLR